MAKVFGRATIFINGKLIDSNKGASLDLGGIERASKVSANKVSGYTESIKQSRMECSLPVTADIDPNDFDLVDVSLLFKSDTGQSWTVPRAWRTDTSTVGDQDGDLSLVFEGEPAEKH